ncbi:hypothetical protein LTR84_002118 [Exophiala bonariae]|uniref:Knr4/Smi1-like domain-containing protein n=1 Tax=Exophiala bonariae TaxID=1690606 RepID=A0AAV9NAD4_9EURO|nr:hypothetical protein LTR84_002118 [Exophiala bonariae]
MSSHDKIAASLTQLYKFFIKFGYLKETQMKWPPHKDLDLDLTLAKNSGLSESSIELLKKIPWADVANTDLAYESKILSYSHDYSFESCRHPVCPSEDVDEEGNPLLDGNLLPLSIATPSYGSHLLVNADRGTIKDWVYLDEGFKDVTEMNAFFFLDAMRKEYEALEEIPSANIILNSEVAPPGGVVSNVEHLGFVILLTQK